jgi:uncharacterized protein (TIGR02284 family)
MVTTVGTASDVVDMLNDLIQLDFDAIQAYEAAIVRIENSEQQRQLQAFRDDHKRHTEELGRVVKGLGAEPASSASMKQVLTVGKVAFADMMGDRAVLQAMKTNEDDTNTAYERAASRSDLPPDAVPVIQSALGDERRHRDWIEKTIATS